MFAAVIATSEVTHSQDDCCKDLDGLDEDFMDPRLKADESQFWENLFRKFKATFFKDQPKDN